MEPFSMAMVGASIAGPVLGGIIGAEAARGDRDRAAAAMQAAFEEINALGAPPDLSKRIIIEKLKSAGVYQPKMEEAIDAGISKVEQIKEDPSLRENSMQALQMLKERASGGLSAQDRADLNKIRGQVGADVQGRLGAIQQGMAARGLGGSGAELAAQLSAASSGASEESAMADRLAAQAQQSALQAALQTGQLSSQLRGQDFDVERAKAEAADRFALFNTQNAQARQQRNVGSQNQAQMYNLAEQQRIGDVNTQMENAERLRMEAAKRQYWQDQATRAGMRANARTGQSAAYQNQADRTAQQWQNVGTGVGRGASAALNYMSRSPASSGGTSSVDQANYDMHSGSGWGQMEPEQGMAIEDSSTGNYRT